MNNASLELGGDNWAAKDTKLLASTVSDDSGRFYPREFTFARGSNLSATRVNADGNIEKGRENLLLQSNNFDTTWTNVNSSVTSGQSGYDGSLDAWELEVTANGTNNRIIQSFSQTGIVTFSVYAKASSTNFIYFYHNGTGARVYFDLQNGTLGNAFLNIDSKIEAVSGASGWYRCSMTINATSSSQIWIIPPNALGNASTDLGNSIFIQDAQAEIGLAATEPIESGVTTGKAGVLENEPRIDYSDGTASLLLEPQRTNLATYSEYIQGLSLTDLTPTPNATTSPEGLQNAYKVLTGTAGSEQILKQVVGTSGNTKTQSVYIKADSGVQWIRLIQLRSGFANSAAVWFDIQNGVKGSKQEGGTTSVVDDATKIEDAGNGWYRLILVCTDSTNNTTFDTRIRTANSNGSGARIFNGSYFVWGLQMESNASYPTSYIPTYGTSVTRGADTNVRTTNADLINQTEGTLFFEGSCDEPVGTTECISLDRSTLGSIFINTNIGKVWFYGYYGNGVTISTVSTISSTANFKAAVAYKSGDTAFYCNGQQVAIKTETFAPSHTLDTIWIAQGDYAGTKNQVSAKQALLFKTRLSNEELAELTTI